MSEGKSAVIDYLRHRVDPALLAESKHSSGRNDIEAVLWPASAIYGPNSSQDVMRVITKEPFDWPGTTLSVSGGGHLGNLLGPAQGLWRAAMRHAGSTGRTPDDRVGERAERVRPFAP